MLNPVQFREEKPEGEGWTGSGKEREEERGRFGEDLDLKKVFTNTRIVKKLPLFRPEGFLVEKLT